MTSERLAKSRANLVARTGVSEATAATIYTDRQFILAYAAAMDAPRHQHDAIVIDALKMYRSLRN